MSTKILDQHAEFIELVHWNNTQSEGRHVAPLAHIILLPNQPGSTDWKGYEEALRGYEN
jgi:hypothetical protein